MIDWTPDETAALLRGETVVRWVEMDEQPENEPVPAHKWPGVRWCAPSLWIWRQKCGCEKSIHAPHRPGDRVTVRCICHDIDPEIDPPCPVCRGAASGGAVCIVMEPERREVPHGRMFDDRYQTPTRWCWREEWRRDDE